jgi:uncharacterized protein (DUF4415 family)
MASKTVKAEKINWRVDIPVASKNAFDQSSSSEQTKSKVSFKYASSSSSFVYLTPSSSCYEEAVLTIVGDDYDSQKKKIDFRMNEDEVKKFQSKMDGFAKRVNDLMERYEDSTKRKE